MKAVFVYPHKVMGSRQQASRDAPNIRVLREGAAFPDERPELRERRKMQDEMTRKAGTEGAAWQESKGRERKAGRAPEPLLTALQQQGVAMRRREASTRIAIPAQPGKWDGATLLLQELRG